MFENMPQFMKSICHKLYKKYNEPKDYYLVYIIWSQTKEEIIDSVIEIPDIVPKEEIHKYIILKFKRPYESFLLLK